MTLLITDARPAPSRINRFFQPYFDGLAESRILVPQCLKCNAKQFPPREVCGYCQGIDFDWANMPLEATIYTYTIVYRAFHPWFSERTPYGVVVGDLGDGIRILGACFDHDIERLACGGVVSAEFELNGELPLLQWRQGSSDR